MKEAFITVLIVGVIVGSVLLFLGSKELKEKGHGTK